MLVFDGFDLIQFIWNLIDVATTSPGEETPRWIRVFRTLVVLIGGIMAALCVLVWIFAAD